MPDTSRTEAMRRKFAGRYEKLEESKRTGPLVAIGKRFFEIDGTTFAGLLAIEFFTTVLPLIILGFSYMHGFAENASVGDLVVHQLGLKGDVAAQVRSAFGTASGLKSSWTIAGIIGFLVWGIPMAITVAAMFGRAWRREQYSIGARLWRGAIWFLLYLVIIASRERIAWGPDVGPWWRAVLIVASFVPMLAFWSLSPVLLVRDGARGRRSLIYAGLAGVIIDGLILGVAAHIAFPILLKGWTGFGPIGVAMTLMTWSGVIGVAWVVTACAGAILWERDASPDIVVDTQSAYLEQRTEPQAEPAVVEGLAHQRVEELVVMPVLSIEPTVPVSPTAEKPGT